MGHRAGRWKTADGVRRVQVGDSSSNLPLTGTVTFRTPRGHQG
ncbi:hypothetical protein ACFWOJ_36655 [Streptomyces sp. NPDC058439]